MPRRQWSPYPLAAAGGQLGVSVGLFLLFGILLNIVPALLLPLLLHPNGPAGAGWLVISNKAGGWHIDRPLAQWVQEKHASLTRVGC